MKDIRRDLKHFAERFGMRLADSAFAVHYSGDVAA